MAYDTNTVVISGRLTRDPECGTTQNGKSRCKFSVASNRGKDTAYFFDVNAWDATADMCGKYLTKGSRVIVTGRLTQDRWTDKEGKNRSNVTITAQEVQFLSNDSINADNRPQQQSYQSKREVKQSDGWDEAPFLAPFNNDPF